MGQPLPLALRYCQGELPAGRLAAGRLANWVEEVNAPQTEAELSALRRAVNRGCPFGAPFWSDQVVRRLGLESTLRSQGRPRKDANGS